ncbi:hypothetical protein [Sulfurimonas sp.]|jgi:hypothetical protein|uniref:hypothetical protein n=1 Tax=Sulfurimonas sp. TaxID=2022749 RepID=UPI0025E189E2|nr:hypothetical protein [Sulfurimonas sp.]MCK9472663.1 hypothetical protein [Sulfurimonas sp.]MDD3505105.1 hypothetical protein [Sulfurimonas sp.]
MKTEIKNQINENKKNSKKFWNTFWGVIVVLLLITSYGIYKKYTLKQYQIDLETKRVLTLSLLQKLDPLFQNFSEEQKEQVLQLMQDKTDKSVDELFENVYDNIDKYLDFHYSVIGEYAELMMAANNTLQENIQKKLFGEEFDELFSKLQANIAADFTTQISKLADNFKEELSQKVHLSSEEEQEVFVTLIEIFQMQIQESVNRVVRSTTFGATAGGGIIAAAVASKLVAKKATQKAALKGGSKFAVKLAASGAAATTGLACGPFALVCGAVAGVVVWVGTDFVLVEADEKLNREKTYNDIKASIDDTKYLLKEDLKNQYKTILQTITDEVQIGTNRKIKELIK